MSPPALLAGAHNALSQPNALEAADAPGLRLGKTLCKPYLVEGFWLGLDLLLGRDGRAIG